MGEITFGIEVEAYTISIPDYRITRELLFPKRGAVERGERFTKDISIGIEYNSKIFHSVREGLFLLKAGLRKYIHRYFFAKGRKKYSQSVFFTGGWRDRFAGAHIHIGLGQKGIDYKTAESLSMALHDHIPFLIAITANSPVWADAITNKASMRLLRGSYEYCGDVKRKKLSRDHYDEMNFNKGTKRKAPTLELRMFDANIPEYLIAALTVVQAVTLRWQRTKKPLNLTRHKLYLQARESAILKGAEATLYWNNEPLTVKEYVDRFFDTFHEELYEMEVPHDILDVFKLLKRGWNGARILRRAALSTRVRSKHVWQRKFSRRYAHAVERLLNGGSLQEFAKNLGVKLPSIRRTQLE